MALIYSSTSIAVTVGTSLTVTHALGVAPTFTVLTVKSNSTTAQVYVVGSNSQIVLLQGGGGIAAAVSYVDMTVVSAHSIIQ